MSTALSRTPPFAVVVFDFDGTLVDSNAIKRQGYFEAAAALGDVVPVVTEVLTGFHGDRAQVLAEIARRAGAGAGVVAGLVARYTAFCEAEIAVCPVVPGAVEMLAALHARGCALFVNSATPTGPLRVLLGRRGWADYFRGIHGSPAGKVENLAAIATATGATPAEMLMVGDGEDDRAAARAFGCAFAGVVLREVRYRGAADATFSDLARLPDWLDRRAPAPAPLS